MSPKRILSWRVPTDSRRAPSSGRINGIPSFRLRATREREREREGEIRDSFEAAGRREMRPRLDAVCRGRRRATLKRVGAALSINGAEGNLSGIHYGVESVAPRNETLSTTFHPTAERARVSFLSARARARGSSSLSALIFRSFLRNIPRYR